MICNNLAINDAGHLTFAGFDTVELAKKYGTPLYVMDENKIREHIRAYKESMAKYFPAGSCPEFASKAFSCKQIYRIAAEEGIHMDAVSSGEIYTAKSVGFPMKNCFFHGNCKTDFDIAYAIESGVGYFVVDNEDELYMLDKIASEKGVVQNILLRVSPGIDTHTHVKIQTGAVDSKFGVAIPTGQAGQTVGKILELKNVKLLGFHCHIGSQIFETGPFITAAELMFEFVAEMKSKFGFKTEIINLGGGFGVRYVESDPDIDYAENIEKIGYAIKSKADSFGIPLPKIMLEPGRSLIADAGITLYTVGSVKEITGFKNYVSIDGGMPDNPRYALYESKYTVLLANRMNNEKNFTATIAGRCCESGDIIQENVLIPRPQRNDILAVLTTGAYNYSMASNYNRLPKAAVVMINHNGDYLAVKRETIEDLCRLDV